MSARSTIATLTGALLLTFGGVAVAAPVTAVPPMAPTAPTEPGDYPLNGQGSTPKDTPRAAPETDERAEKAERLGGGVATEVIDLFTGVIKCGLNIATDSVPCSL
ncbi:hypothetical protein ACFO5K_14165 [Nocardia halotolerans]|uniref:DUF732 domain-containing protein n=1 Tax=Nocardia halotolerans TaxID=1755878 RepID=A0ABV8VGR9_9NOCA